MEAAAGILPRTHDLDALETDYSDLKDGWENDKGASKGAVVSLELGRAYGVDPGWSYAERERGGLQYLESWVS
jgi:hypothetical protein